MEDLIKPFLQDVLEVVIEIFLVTPNLCGVDYIEDTPDQYHVNTMVADLETRNLPNINLTLDESDLTGGKCRYTAKTYKICHHTTDSSTFSDTYRVSQKKNRL